MLTIIVGSIVLTLAALLAYVATRPDTFRVERTTTVHAVPEQIHPLIEDLHAHERWSPFLRKDAAMKKSYGGPARGVGATFDFDGDPKTLGSGRLTVTGTAPPRSVTMRLQMFKPMQGDNVVEFRLAPKGPVSTDVTWSITGRQPFVGKLMGLVFDMDQMIGKDFTQGLADLKRAAERTPDTVTAG